MQDPRRAALQLRDRGGVLPVETSACCSSPVAAAVSSLSHRETSRQAVALPFSTMAQPPTFCPAGRFIFIHAGLELICWLGLGALELGPRLTMATNQTAVFDSNWWRWYQLACTPPGPHCLAPCSRHSLSVCLAAAAAAAAATRVGNSRIVLLQGGVGLRESDLQSGLRPRRAWPRSERPGGAWSVLAGPAAQRFCCNPSSLHGNAPAQQRAAHKQVAARGQVGWRWHSRCTGSSAFVGSLAAA